MNSLLESGVSNTGAIHNSGLNSKLSIPTEDHNDQTNISQNSKNSENQ